MQRKPFAQTCLKTFRLNFLSNLLEGLAHADGSDFLLAHPHPTSSCLSSAVCRKDAAHILYPLQLPQCDLLFKHSFYGAESGKCVKRVDLWTRFGEGVVLEETVEDFLQLLSYPSWVGPADL